LNFNITEAIMQKHPFHIVKPSPWPLYVSASIFCCVLTLLDLFEGVIDFNKYSLLELNEYTYGLYCLGLFLTCWFYDIIIEATYEGHHTFAVQKNLRLGVVLFIISEIMFFVSFFWAFFHASINPSIWIGEVWPPIGIIPLNPWTIPFTNTIILLTSGLTLTWAHYLLILRTSFTDRLNINFNIVKILFYNFYLYRFELSLIRVYIYNELNNNKYEELLYSLPINDNTTIKLVNFYNIYYIPTINYLIQYFYFFFKPTILSGLRSSGLIPFMFIWSGMFKYATINNRGGVILGLCTTILLGCLFSLLQRYEYIHALFTINDGIYGSTFYMLTGLHGLHVIIGTIFLTVCLIRHIKYHFTSTHHVGFEAAIWYWHFVDVVWIFVFISLYWFGGK